MAGDLGRVFPLGPAGDHPAEGAYRVNPTGKDQGRSSQERFQDSLDRRKRRHADKDELPDSGEEKAAEAGGGPTAGRELLIEDRVSLSSRPFPEQAADANSVEAGLNQRGEPSGPGAVVTLSALDPPRPPDDESKPPSGKGRVNVIA